MGHSLAANQYTARREGLQRGKMQLLRTTWQLKTTTIVLLLSTESRFFFWFMPFHGLRSLLWRSWRKIEVWLRNSAGAKHTREMQFFGKRKQVVWFISWLFSWEFTASIGRRLMNTWICHRLCCHTYHFCTSCTARFRCSVSEGDESRGVRSRAGGLIPVLNRWGPAE